MTEKELRDKTKALGHIDKLIHEPARLLIISYLYILESADFIFLKAETGLTWGNLSTHISKLEQAEYVYIEKKFIRKKPHTLAKLTDQGKRAFEEYKKIMNQALN